MVETITAHLLNASQTSNSDAATQGAELAAIFSSPAEEYEVFTAVDRAETQVDNVWLSEVLFQAALLIDGALGRTLLTASAEVGRSQDSWQRGHKHNSVSA